MKKGLMILTIFLLLIPNFVLAEVTSDILVNVVKQETNKVKMELTVKLDTKFNELDNALMEGMKNSENRINESIDSRLSFMLLKWSSGLFFSFLLALFVYHYLTSKQERNNPYYMKYKDKQAQMKTMVKVKETQKNMADEKTKQDALKEKINPPKETNSSGLDDADTKICDKTLKESASKVSGIIEAQVGVNPTQKQKEEQQAHQKSYTSKEVKNLLKEKIDRINAIKTEKKEEYTREEVNVLLKEVI